MGIYLYVLNHNFQRIHLETFFWVGGFSVEGSGSDMISLGVSIFLLVVQQEWPYSMAQSDPREYPFLPYHKHIQG